MGNTYVPTGKEWINLITNEKMTDLLTHRQTTKYSKVLSFKSLGNI